MMEQLSEKELAIKGKHPHSNNFITVDAWDSIEDKELFYQKILKSSTEQVVYLGQNEWNYYSDTALPRFQSILDFLSSQNRRFLITTCSYPHQTEPPKHPNLTVYHWVDWFMKKTFNTCVFVSRDYSGANYGDFDYYKQSLNKENFDYHLTSLNHRSHFHRCLMMDLLAKNNLVENNAIGWHNLSNYGSLSHVYPWQYFKPRVLSFTNNFNSSWDRPPAEYFNSFAQLISESSQDVSMFTEKTAMALICHKPFLIAGPTEIHKKLKELNFELYDELFDYSFDLEPNEEKRYQMIMDNFVSLQKENTLADLKKLQEKIKPKIIYNFENLKRIVFDFNMMPPIVKKIFEVYNITGIDHGHHSNSVLVGLNHARKATYK